MNVEISAEEATRIRIALGQKVDIELQKPQSDKRARNVKKYRDLINKFVPSAERDFH